nr:hypothetical protein [Janthinobacterium sp.]
MAVQRPAFEPERARWPGTACETGRARRAWHRAPRRRTVPRIYRRRALHAALQRPDGACGRSGSRRRAPDCADARQGRRGAGQQRPGREKRRAAGDHGSDEDGAHHRRAA